MVKFLRGSLAAILATMMAVLLALPVYAQQLGIKVAPATRIYPEFGMSVLYDTNFFATTGNGEDVGGVALRPALAIRKEGSRGKVEAGARADITEFFNGNEDDFEDSTLFTDFEYTATRRNRFRLRLERDDKHNPFGRERTEGLPIASRSLDEFHDYLAAFSYRFGASRALFNAQYDFSFFDRRYETNRRATRFLDFDRFRHRGTFFYNYSPRSSALLRVSTADIEFDDVRFGNFSRDARLNRYNVGLNWRATAKTSGQALIGYFERDPDSSGFRETDGIDWDVSVNWAPRSRTTFTLATGRDINESFRLQSSFINTQKYQATWRQRWTRLFSTSLALRYFDQEFEQEALRREDDFYRAQLQGSYQLTQAFSLQGLFGYSDRESTRPLAEFSKEFFSVGFIYAP